MTGDADDFPGSDDLRPPGLSPEVEAEIHRLTEILLERQINEMQRRRLEEIVAGDPAAAETYLAIVYEWGSLPNYVGQGSVDISAADMAVPTEAGQLNETMILPAVRPQDLDVDEEAPLVLPTHVPVQTRRPRRWLGFAAAIALATGLSIAVYRATRPAVTVAEKTSPGQIDSIPSAAPAPPAVPVPPASITAIAAFNPGPNFVSETLESGRQIQVGDGAIEITFASGAVVVVRAPARFHIADRDSIVLDDGSLSAHVPVEARGFHVVSPGLLTVDRGTDFGVRTHAGDLASEVHIFGGIVDVSATGTDGKSIGRPVRAVTGNAFGHDAAGTSSPAPVTFAPESFSRDIAAIRRPIAMHNTGDGLAGGQPDPNWILKSAPDELNWKPGPGIVVSNPVYINQPNSPTVKWLSNGGSGPAAPTGYYVFTTAVDLTGVEPSTAKIQAIVTADDLATDIKINGVSTGLSTNAAVLAADYRQTTLEIPAKFWRPGINQVEFVIHNDNSSDGARTEMGLQVQWVGDACTAVQR